MEKIKRKDGFRYREKIYIDARVIQSPYFKRKTDAKAWKRGRVLERDRIKALGLSHIEDIGLNEYFIKFMERRSDKTNKTKTGYESIFRNHISPTQGHKNLRQLRLNDGEELKISMRKKGQSIRSINNVLNLLKTIVNDAIKFDYLLSSPFKALDFIREIPKDLVYWLPHEANAFLRHARSSHYYALYMVTLNMGLRKGEVLGMQLSQIDFFNKQITVNHTVDRHGLSNTTKNGKARTLKMNDTVFNALKEYMETKRVGNSQFVFTRPDGSQIDYTHFTNRVFVKDIEASGLRRIKFHELRKTFASNFMMQKGNIYVLSKILGHSSIEVTQKNYAHLHPDFLFEESQVINFSAENSPDLALKIVK